MTAVFVILALVFRKGKGSFLIAGYNTASKAEKEKIDEKKLCKYISNLMFAIAACWLVVTSSEIFHKIWLLWLGLILLFVVIIIGLVIINTGNRIKR